MAKNLNVPEALSFRVYPSTALAVVEVVQGLIQFFPHKRVLAQIKGASPAFSFLMPSLYKDGFEMQTCLPENSEVEFLSGLKPETNFVLSAADQPVTGQIYSHSERFQSVFAKKIFSIEVSHASWLRDSKNWNVNPFEIRILEVSSELAFVVAGSRFRASAVVTPHMHWEQSRVLKIWKDRADSFQEDQNLVRDFVAKLPQGWQAWPPAPIQLWDRVFIFNQNLNSEIYDKENFASTSLCALNERMGFFDWWLPSPSPEILRGGLCVSLKALQTSFALSEL